MLYNEDQKMQYINETVFDEKDKINTINLFKRIGREIEFQINKDVADFSYDDALLAVTTLGGTKISSVQWYISKFKNYEDWCILNGKSINNENIFNILDASDIDLSFIYKLYMIKNPEELQNVLDITLPSIIENTTHNMTILYVWLLFDGINQEYITEIKREDIDLNNKSIFIKELNKSVQLNNFTLDVLKMVMENDKMIRPYKWGRETNIKIYNQEYIMKISQEETNLRAVYKNKLSRLASDYRKKTGSCFKITPNKIYESGFYYRTYQNESRGEEIDFNQLTNDIYLSGYEKANKWIRTQMTKQIKDSYNNWKQAFNL